MPKRTRADRHDGDFAPATRAAINRHGWEELRHAYQTGRLIFLEGVGAKVATEISLLLQSSPGASREPNHWERLLDLVRPHLNSEWIARLATWNESQIVGESLLKRVEAICALRPQYANSALLRSFLAAASKEVRAHLEMDQDLSWPDFNASEARARPYEYLCQNWKLPLRITDNIAIAENWWWPQSSARLRAYLEEGLKELIQTDGHTVYGREQLLQHCMKQLKDCPKPLSRAAWRRCYARTKSSLVCALVDRRPARILYPTRWPMQRFLAKNAPLPMPSFSS